MALDHGNEIQVPTVNGERLCFETTHDNSEGCSYIRFVDANGNQLAYWVCNEWKEAPQEVMGAIMGCLLNGARL